MIQRYAVAFFVAGLVTFGLFYLMQALIGVAGELGEENKGRVIDFVRLKREEDVQEKERELPDKKPPEEPPPPPDIDMSSVKPEAGDTGGLGLLDTGLDLGDGLGIGSGAGDSDAVPLVRVQPMYPPTASARGVEGWVEIEFSISKAGTVKDAKVINYHPSRVFNRAALKAIRGWKYNPKVVDGNPVERPGMTVRLTFELEG